MAINNTTAGTYRVDFRDRATQSDGFAALMQAVAMFGRSAFEPIGGE